MTTNKGGFLKLGRAAILGAVCAVALAPAALAQATSEADIVKALRPPPGGSTRSLTITPVSPTAAPAAESEDAAFEDGLRNRRSQSLSNGERTKLAAISTEKPSINLEIPFDFASARIGAKTVPAVRNLGSALIRPELRGGTFLIAGHTDGKGGDASNQQLSERRAESVKQYLVRNFGIPAANLIAVGYGKGRPKNKLDPLAEENRRVEITNMSDVKSASR